MVAGPVGNFHSELRNDPLVREMRRVREQNAQRYKADYSHVFRNKSRWDFVRISAVIMGMEFVYSAETAFVTPILLGIGVEHQLMTLVWAISPIIGFFLAPILGTISDRCRSNFGRRRPILIGLGITLLLGCCILVPYGENIGQLFGDLGEYFVNTTANATGVLNGNQTTPLPFDLYQFDAQGNLDAVLDLNMTTYQPKPFQYYHVDAQGGIDAGFDANLTKYTTFDFVPIDIPTTTGATPEVNSTTQSLYEFYQIDQQITGHVMDYKWAIFITILGVIMMDFSADTMQTPSRAYLLDICLPDDHGRACSTFSILAGFGGSLGYVLGGINWDNTQFGVFLGGSIKTVFFIVGVIFFISLMVTLASFREIPLPLMEQDELLRPLTEAIINKERAKMNDKIYYIKDVSKSLTAQLKVIDQSQQSSSKLLNNALAEVEKGSLPPSQEHPCEEPEETHMTLTDFLKSIIMMPKSIALLCLTNLLCWMGHLSFCLYFTDFVGEAVFHGNPAAPSMSVEYQLYLEGVRYGCFGLAIYSIACSCYSFSIELLIKVLRARMVYVGGLMIDAVGMILMAVFPSKITVFVFAATGGIVYALLFTMPFLLLGQYHAKGQFKTSKVEGSTEPENKRGLATDIAVVGGQIFVAQIIISFGMGSLIQALGTTAAVIYCAGVCSFLGALAATQVVYMDL